VPLFLVFLFVSSSWAAVPAFPGAQGGGAASVGGRGGVVMNVTNLNDAGAGSARSCLEGSGPRTCIVRVSGTVNLQSGIHILNPFVTWAGQTAPGGGVQFANLPGSLGDLIRIGTHDVVLRYLKARVQQPNTGGNPSPISILNEPASVFNVILDHCSTAWGFWDNFDLWMGGFNSFFAYNLTVQQSILAEPIYASNGAVQVQISGATPAISDLMTDIDFHHNLLTGGNHRNPIHRVKTGRMVSNLVYNTSYYDLKGGAAKDFISNYVKMGPYNAGQPLVEIQGYTAYDVGSTAPLSLYIVGNAADSNGFNPNANQWAGKLTGLAIGEDDSDSVTSPLSTQYQRTVPLPAQAFPITADAAPTLADPAGAFLAGVGAGARLGCDGTWIHNRDSLDTRYVNEFITNTGHASNVNAPGPLPSLGAGSPCVESLNDGIPDQWKTARGLSLTDAGLNARIDPTTGYTYLEDYLDGITAAPPPPPPPPPPVTGAYEAEAVTMGPGVRVFACPLCSGGAEVGDIGTLTFSNVVAASAGAYVLTIAYLNGAAAPRPGNLSINGGPVVSIPFPVTGNWTNPVNLALTVQLAAGVNVLAFAGPGAAYMADLDKISIAPAPPPVAVTYEAESPANTLTGSATVGACPPCSGGLNVQNLGGPRFGTLTFNGVTVGAAGSYLLTVQFDNGYTANLDSLVSVNGGAGQTIISFPPTGGWLTLANSTLTVNLQAGANTIRFYNSSAAYIAEIDKLTVSAK
jgi:hypothetical protein